MPSTVSLIGVEEKALSISVQSGVSPSILISKSFNTNSFGDIYLSVIEISIVNDLLV